MSIVDTGPGQQLPTSLYTDASHPPRAKWLAHNNTIFDMAWAKVGGDGPVVVRWWLGRGFKGVT